MVRTEKVFPIKNLKVGKGRELISAVSGRCLRVFKKIGRMDGGKKTSPKVYR
jgi:hypothetical protein